MAYPSCAAFPQGEYAAVELSNDQKPDREDEAKRIRNCRGRVEACKSVSGQDIGPLRVWLQHQDVPGLAMTRSFGDLIAASVRVAQLEPPVIRVPSDPVATQPRLYRWASFQSPRCWCAIASRTRMRT